MAARTGIIAGLAIVVALWWPNAWAAAEAPVTVVITQGDLAWPVSDSGSMNWWGFGSQVSQDPKCTPQVMGGPITALHFEVTVDVSADPAVLTGTLSGSGDWQNPAIDDPAYGQERGRWSFSGPIVDGWAREADGGWAWGGNAELTLDFAGLRICSIDLDDAGEEVYVIAEGSGQRRVTVRFVGGAGAYGEDSGFSLNGFSAPDWEPGQDVWGISLGCNGCDIPLPLPVGSGDSGVGPGGDQSVSSVPQAPAGGQTPAAEQDDDEEDPFDVWTALFGDADVGPERGWSPAGVAILILFLALLGLTAGMVLKEAISVALTTRVHSFRMLPTPGQTATLAQDAGRVISGQRRVTVESPLQPRSSPDPGAAPAGWVMQPGQPYIMSGNEDAEPGEWVQVRQWENTGWVHRSTVQFWHPREIARPLHLGAGDYRETVDFPCDFDTRNPVGSNYTRQSPGRYALGPPGRDGFRPVYTPDGSLMGSIPSDKVPSTLTKGGAPPPPPPPPPP